MSPNLPKSRLSYYQAFHATKLPVMLAHKLKDVSLQVFNLVVGIYLQPFEGVLTYVPITWKEFII